MAEKIKFNNASEAFKRLNPQLFGLGGLQTAEPKPDRQCVGETADRAQKAGPCGVVICMVSFRRRTLDDDNLSGACKWLRDAIAASLGIDDGDSRLRWEYAQIETKGKEGTAVHISLTTDGHR